MTSSPPIRKRTWVRRYSNVFSTPSFSIFKLGRVVELGCWCMALIHYVEKYFFAIKKQSYTIRKKRKKKKKERRKEVSGREEGKKGGKQGEGRKER